MLMVATLPVAAMSVEPKLFNKVDKQAMESWVNNTFNSMSPDERITQLFVMAVGPRMSGAEGLVKKLVSEYKVGGLIYHESDITSQAKLTNYAQSLSTVPLLITLDAEWGPSMRLVDAPKFPRNLYLGASGDEKLFYDYGREVARVNLGEEGDITPYDATTPDYVNPLLANGSPLAHFNLSKHIDCLVEGENTLAIQIHNINESSGDLLLYPFLTVGSTVKSGKQPSELIGLQSKSEAKFFHTNFSISADGEPIFLVNTSGKIVCQTDSTVVPNDVSRGLLPDGNGKWRFFAEPTPGVANTTKSYSSARTNEITFSLTGGLQTGKQTLTMSSAAGTPIYYTTDGSVPTTKSKLYSSPLSLSKTTIVRAVSYCDTLLPGQPATRSFIFPDHKTSLPVFSLVTDPYNLYDYNYGIYVEGPDAEEADPHFGANYHKDWERPMHVELFWPDGTEKINQDAGVKIAGA